MSRRKRGCKPACKDPECAHHKPEHTSFCTKCWSKTWREAHPTAHAFRNLKGSAKRRKIPFKLTLEEFTEWSDQTGYVKNKGKLHPNDSTVDRINSSGAYQIGNIRIMTHHENCSRKNKPDADSVIEPF